jgi:hypothetical protein
LYSGLALSGGYMRFGPPQISSFPIPVDLDLKLSSNMSIDEIEEKVCSAYSVDLKSVELAFARNFGGDGVHDGILSDEETDEG